MDAIFFKRQPQDLLFVASFEMKRARLKASSFPHKPHTSLCIQFLGNENNGKNNRLPLGVWLCFGIVWGFTEIFQCTWHLCKSEEIKKKEKNCKLTCKEKEIIHG